MFSVGGMSGACLDLSTVVGSKLERWATELSFEFSIDDVAPLQDVASREPDPPVAKLERWDAGLSLDVSEGKST